MKKTRLIILIISIFLSLIFTNVNAGSVDISFSGNDTVYVGDNVDVTIKVSNITGLNNGMATLQADIAFDEGYLEYVKSEDVSSELSVSYGTRTKRFVALGMGGESISSSGNLLKITFKAKNPGVANLNLSNTVVGDTNAIVHSANVSQKKITIIGKGETPKQEEPTSVPSNDNTGNTGNKQTTKKNTTPTTTKTPETSTNTKSSDATLSKLLVNNSKMSPSFDKNVTSYNVEVSSNVTKAVISFVPTNSKAKAELIGNPELKEGVNILQVVVTAEDGSKKTYTLNITKSNETSNTKLVLLNVAESKKLNFNEDKYKYNINVKSNVKKLTIDAVPKDKNSKVEILGNKNLSAGDNMVLIKVTDKKGFSSYYKLNVKKDDRVTLFGIDILYWFISLLLLLFLLLFIILFLKRRKDDDDDNHKTIKLEVREVDNIKENKDIYDDVVTKEEIIEAIEEKNPKKLKMLLTQEEANKLKEELKKEEDE